MLTEIFVAVMAMVGIATGTVSYDAADAERVGLHEVACYVECFDLCLVTGPVTP